MSWLKPPKVNINKSFPPLSLLASSPAVRCLALCLFSGCVRLRRRVVCVGLRVHEDEACEDGDDGDEDNVVFEVIVNRSHDYLALIV